LRQHRGSSEGESYYEEEEEEELEEELLTGSDSAQDAASAYAE
jgi:hypothetical protein